GRVVLDDRERGADRVVIAAAGAVGHEELLDMCREAFQSLPVGHSTLKRDKPDFNPGLFVCSRDIEQVHILAGLPGLSVTDPRRETAELMIAALGGGMSSRLFQSVREQRGKSYSVYAFLNPFSDIGYTAIYASTNRSDVTEVIGLITDELRELRRTGLKPEELQRTRTQLIGGIPLSLESTDSRMFRIAKNQLYFGEEIPVSKVIEDIGAVTNDDIIELAQDMFAFERMGVALLGDADPGMLSLPVS
ncbi:MAG: M16 family metallopeptidase, partial [Candidatus Binatia bacterium]